MSERYVLCLEERSVKYADDPAHPDRVTEIWRMNKRGPNEIGTLYDYIEAKITEGPHLNRNRCNGNWNGNRKTFSRTKPRDRATPP